MVPTALIPMKWTGPPTKAFLLPGLAAFCHAVNLHTPELNVILNKSSIPTPLQYVVCISSLTFSSSLAGQTTFMPGVPGVWYFIKLCHHISKLLFHLFNQVWLSNSMLGLIFVVMNLTTQKILWTFFHLHLEKHFQTFHCLIQ